MTAQAEGADSLISAFSGIIVFVIILVIGGLVVFGRGAISSVVKYILPILIFVSIILAIYFWVRSEYTFMIFAIVALVIFIGLMIYTTFFRKPKIPLSKPIPSQINKTSPPK